ncbi:MAG: hypothetical protein LBU65_00110 [Planctomycetaceae bacterium]|nr:hypothetical protein [Planctomycetaceae bacterium]
MTNYVKTQINQMLKWGGGAQVTVNAVFALLARLLLWLNFLLLSPSLAF